MTELTWEQVQSHNQQIWRCELKEIVIEFWPRPAYCDRARWEAHIHDRGFPTNPSPIDHADNFPRWYFSLERGKDEMEDFCRIRRYTPQ